MDSLKQRKHFTTLLYWLRLGGCRHVFDESLRV